MSESSHETAKDLPPIATTALVDTGKQGVSGSCYTHMPPIVKAFETRTRRVMREGISEKKDEIRSWVCRSSKTRSTRHGRTIEGSLERRSRDAWPEVSKQHKNVTSSVHRGESRKRARKRDYGMTMGQ